MNGNPPNWVFSVLAFFSFLLCIIPLPWHLEAWNTGTCLFMGWTALGLLNQFINSVVWNSDTINKAPVWCDISSQIIIAVSVAIPASSLCINRRLFQIASVSSVTKTHAQKRRDVLTDLAIGLGIPFLVMALHPIVQSHRFIIVEQLGCSPFTLNTPPAYPLYIVWPLVISLISASYSVRTIRQLAIRRAQFREFLSANRNLSSGRYFRLMGLASGDIVFSIPLSIFILWLDLKGDSIEAYVDWNSAHANFDIIPLVPAVEWQASQLTSTSFQLSRYSLILCAFLFFFFFGFADEAMRNYRIAYASVAKRVGLSTGAFSVTGTWSAHGTNPDVSHSTNMPVYITQETEKERDSFGSFSSRMSLPDFGGALADVKQGTPYSPTATSSGSISKESLPRLPIDLDDVVLPSLPETTLDASAPPRYTPSTPRAV